MDNLKLGEIITGEAQRDAIHIAVVPIVAACKLHPGERVGVMIDGRAEPYMPKSVGIVDPFLETDVLEGQRFWLFLFPNTVTSLRHEWTHPAFPSHVDNRIIELKKQIQEMEEDRDNGEEYCIC